jgi:hypothetical protein
MSVVVYNLMFSYSEWWRYIGPEKPRQPLNSKEGANLSVQPIFLDNEQ